MSNNAFIDLHEQMQNKGWISDWEFNESIDLYKYNNCTSIAACQSIGEGDYKSDIVDNAWIYHLGKLTDGYQMFAYTTVLASFSGDLSSLDYGGHMFSNTPLTSFSGDLSNLTDSTYMFNKSALTSFSGDLPSLTDGLCMFYNSTLESFDGDLSSLTRGQSMFRNSSLTSFNGDLSSLINGSYMFLRTALTSFSGDLPNLTNGVQMFHITPLTSFSGDLSKLNNGGLMFYRTPLTSFNGDLSNLTSGYHMFSNIALTSFDRDLSKLTNGYKMFYNSALESFNGDLSSLTDGSYMFCYTHARTYNIKHYKMVNGVKQEVETSVTATGLKSFNSDLSSLTNGYMMFGRSATTCSPLNEESIMIIADTINNIKGLGLTGEYGQLWLGYDKSITDKTNIFKYCNEIVAKGWTVYLNGSSTPYDPSNPATLIDGESTTTPIPHYYKPLQVTNEDIAEYVDADNNYYIIVGGQHVFGDDISTYGMFTSYEHAVNEISISLSLTPCEKPDEEES